MAFTRAAKARAASESDLEMFRTPRTNLPSPPSQSSSKTVTPPSPGYVCTICRNSEDLRNIFANKTYPRCDETVNSFDSILHEIKVSLESITSRIKAVEDCMVIHKDSIKELENNIKIFYSVSSNLPLSQQSHNKETINISRSQASNGIFQSRIHNSHSTRHNSNTGLVVGDSNTRHIKLNNVAFTRLPTYTIEAVDPQKCKGYAKVWLCVGVNSLKRCRSPRKVYQCFQLLMFKIDQIHKISPTTKLMVSPILPTGIPTLNPKSLYFNHLLTTTPKWWTPLDFNIFADSNRLLADRFRSYRNKHDLIHLGFQGIRTLNDIISNQLSRVDGRSYAYVTKLNT